MIPGGFAYGHLCGPSLDGVLYSGLLEGHNWVYLEKRRCLSFNKNANCIGNYTLNRNKE